MQLVVVLAFSAIMLLHSICISLSFIFDIQHIVFYKKHMETMTINTHNYYNKIKVSICDRSRSICEWKETSLSEEILVVIKHVIRGN